jgi:hypothetical protein
VRSQLNARTLASNRPNESVKESALAVVHSAFGLPSWQVRWDSQIGLDLNFGPPTLEVRDPRPIVNGSARVSASFARRGVYLRGSHWLLVSAPHWRVELAGGFVVRDTGSVTRLNQVVARLKGEKLEGLYVNSRTGMTTFYFDLGGRIVARGNSNAPPDSEIWTISNNSRSVAVYAGGGYTYNSVKASPGDPLPIISNEQGWLVIARTAKLRRDILRTLRNPAR